MKAISDNYISDNYTPPSNANHSNVNRSNVDTLNANRSNADRSNVNHSNVNGSNAKLPQSEQEKITCDLFNVLPFSADNDHEPMFTCIEYIPGIANQLKRSFAKAGINTTFSAPQKLKNILCSRNSTKPPKEKNKGIYKYDCPCSPTATYIGQTARSYEIRWDEHLKAINTEKWSHSGISQHYQNCTHTPNKDNFSIVKNMQGKNKKFLSYNMRIREALEIRRHKCGPGKGLNEDMGAYVKTDMWDPVLQSIT